MRISAEDRELRLAAYRRARNDLEAAKLAGITPAAFATWRRKQALPLKERSPDEEGNAASRERYRTDAAHRERVKARSRARSLAQGHAVKGARTGDVRRLRELADDIWLNRARNARPQRPQVFGDPVDVSRLRVSLPVEEALSPAGYAVLRVVGARPGLSHREVAGVLGLRRSTVSHHVNELVRLGLVERVEDSEDRRKVRVFVRGSQRGGRAA